MRNLNKNMSALWLVNPVSSVENTDSEGFLTGHFITTFSTPVKILIALYPANGMIVEQIFGKDYSCDQLAVSNNVVLDKKSLLFENQPFANFATTYDYTVDKIKKSLNTYQYGLRRRV